jgi:hypothetical protein
MGQINAEWHLQHPMPDKPTARQRAEWHYEHAMNCGCRAVTPAIAKLMKDHGFEFPEPAAHDRDDGEAA